MLSLSQGGLSGHRARPQLTDNRDVLLTRRGDTLYVHLNRVPVGTAIHLPPLTTLPASAVLLNTGCEVQARVDLVPTRRDTGPCLRLRDLPLDAMAGTVPVIKLQYCAPIC